MPPMSLRSASRRSASLASVGCLAGSALIALGSAPAAGVGSVFVSTTGWAYARSSSVNTGTYCVENTEGAAPVNHSFGGISGTSSDEHSHDYVSQADVSDQGAVHSTAQWGIASTLDGSGELSKSTLSFGSFLQATNSKGTSDSHCYAFARSSGTATVGFTISQAQNIEITATGDHNGFVELYDAGHVQVLYAANDPALYPGVPTSDSATLPAGDYDLEVTEEVEELSAGQGQTFNGGLGATETQHGTFVISVGSQSDGQSGGQSGGHSDGRATGPTKGKGKQYVKFTAARDCGAKTVKATFKKGPKPMVRATEFIDKKQKGVIKHPKPGKKATVKKLGTEAITYTIKVRLANGKTVSAYRRYAAC